MFKRLPNENEFINEIIVSTKRSDEFRELIKNKGEIVDVVELKGNQENDGCLLFFVISKIKNDEYIFDLGFHSFIKNPEFLKYYKNK
jgi:hypothetical protein